MNVQLLSTPPSGQGRGEYIQSVTAKGQVTIPVELRKLIGVQPNSQVIVSVQAGRVVIAPVEMTLEEAFGSVQPLTRPEDFQKLREIALEEHAERVIRKMSTK
jgi:AbrB family looped-hinge helix DNA binding protein